VGRKARAQDSRALRAAAGALALLSVGALACRPVSRAVDPARGAPLAVTPAFCEAASTDSDRDGLDDNCELTLAQAFAPILLVDSRDCIWTTRSEPRLGGGYLFASQPVADGVRIAFLPAYFQDCGWRGALCWFRGPRCGAHAGDSEMIVVDVAPADGGRWATAGVFLSAHCFGRSDGRCRWYRGDELGQFSWADGVTRGAPRAWVALGKHANYPSRESCDSGHWGNDTCDGNREAVRFPVRSARQNIGSRHHPSPMPDACIASDQLPLGTTGTSVGTRECLWRDAQPFWGWQSDRFGTPPTPYARYLERFAAF
jgi:hypothetical protein